MHGLVSPCGMGFLSFSYVVCKGDGSFSGKVVVAPQVVITGIFCDKIVGELLKLLLRP